MAQPDTAVPYAADTFNHHIRLFENFLMSDDHEFATLGLHELPSFSQQTNFPINPQMLQSTAGDTEINPPIDSFVIDHEMFEEDFQMDPSRTQDQETNFGVMDHRPIDDFGNPIQISAWPVQAPPYTCSCCQVLREIMHTNGVDVAKLEVHGRQGMIYHAVLEMYRVDLTTNQSHDYRMFDFCNKSISRVKQFLEEYCKDRKANGYVMLQDPLSMFYEAVCVGLDWEFNLDTDDLISLDLPGDNQINQADTDSNGARLFNKSTLSMQRERTGKLTMRDFVNYFHVPIEVAAKKIQVCPTVMKKICRKHGLSRWPYRKIKSIERKISMKAKCLTSVDGEERARAQADIHKLRLEIANIYSRFNHY